LGAAVLIRVLNVGIFVAVDNEQIVRGFADFRWGETETKAFVGDNEAEVRAIYVEPDYWGEGIGTVLLEQGIEQFPDKVDTIYLEMLSGNKVGQQFYETYGFERTDTSEFEIDETPYPTVVYRLCI
jgi:ribosomal protein S18 acetylase RimI-like enzyme